MILSTYMSAPSVRFVGSFMGTEELFSDDLPKIALIGRSNVGKSSLINALTASGISRTSALPGATKELNVFLVNNSIHLVDLPGYGYARGSIGFRTKMRDLIKQYLLNKKYTQAAVVLIIDAGVGMTDRDESMYADLQDAGKNIIIAANKIDRLSQSEYHHAMQRITAAAQGCPVFPVSAAKKTGIKELAEALGIGGR